jgi:hypothetical protein
MESSVPKSSAAKHKSKYIASITGPLLFTAPHSGKLNRGGVLYGEKKRIHKREIYASVLAMRFALDTAAHFQSATKVKG